MSWIWVRKPRFKGMELLLSVFTSCRWHRDPFLPELPRIQLAPGPPSPPACPAWTAHQTSLSPPPSHPRCSPGDGSRRRDDIKQTWICVWTTHIFKNVFPQKGVHVRHVQRFIVFTTTRIPFHTTGSWRGPSSAGKHHWCSETRPSPAPRWP